MFGFFKKKIDTLETTDRSIIFLNSLPSEIKIQVIEGIEIFLKMIVNKEINEDKAFSNAMEAKQNCMFRLSLKDHRHPEFSMFQLIEDAYLSLYAHEKIKSGKYSANKFVDFMIENSTNKRKTMILLSGSGFDPINLF